MEGGERWGGKRSDIKYVIGEVSERLHTAVRLNNVIVACFSTVDGKLREEGLLKSSQAFVNRRWGRTIEAARFLRQRAAVDCLSSSRYTERNLTKFYSSTSPTLLARSPELTGIKAV